MEHKDSIFEDITVEEVKSPYFQRLLINLSDCLIEVAIVVALYLAFPTETLSDLLSTNPLMKFILTLIVIFAYRLICMVLIGRTIGMIIFRSKYLNKDLLPLTQKERLRAVFLTRTSSIKNYKV